jgi:hypothetical protein
MTDAISGVAVATPAIVPKRLIASRRDIPSRTTSGVSISETLSSCLTASLTSASETEVSSR